MDINKPLQLASQYHQQGNLQQAEIIYKEMLKINPYDFHILNYLGNVLQDQHKYDEAIDCYQKATEFNPTFAGSYYHLGSVFEITDQYEKAIYYYKKAIDYDPNFCGSYNNLGNIYRKLGQEDTAIPYFEKAIEINPNFWGSYYNLGEVYQSKDINSKAIKCYQKVMQLNPHHIATLNNLGNICLERKEIDEALLHYQKAIHLQPDYAEPYFNKSLIMLLMGNFKEGWKEYEWRWKTQDNTYLQRNFPQPVWDGSSLNGKTLFIYTEQGVGDEIMFASCFPDVLNLTESFIIECDKRLIPLFSRSFSGTQFIERIGTDKSVKSGLPFFDTVVAMGSLPLHFRTTLSSFPQKSSYLIPDSQKVDEWRKRFKTLGDGVKLGISWRGGNSTRLRKARSITLEKWKELFLLKGVHLINLQYGDCATELKEVREQQGIIIHEWEDADPLKDLDNFASQISALDLVISVDNATVHMAGALGKPVWTLIPYKPDWRWMLNREDSPWYPTMRLFRQPSPGDWESVIAKVTDELLKLLGN
jgi:tetratricopeptide (TPR) repeat protein